jgi:hypothetical protein
MRARVARGLLRPAGEGCGKLLARFCEITSWVSLYRHVQLPAAAALFHAPLLLPRALRADSVFVLFRCNESELAMFGETTTNLAARDFADLASE